MILTYFNVSCPCFLHSWARDPGPGPKAAAGRARAGPLAAALGPGPGAWAQECKEKWKGYVTDFREFLLKSVNFHAGIYPRHSWEHGSHVATYA